jgi:hypothetical protein
VRGQRRVPEPDDPDEFNDHQLVGLRAETPAGRCSARCPDRPRARGRPARAAAPDGREGLVPFVGPSCRVDLPAAAW